MAGLVSAVASRLYPTHTEVLSKLNRPRGLCPPGSSICATGGRCQETAPALGAAKTLRLFRSAVGLTQDSRSDA